MDKLREELTLLIGGVVILLFKALWDKYLKKVEHQKKEAEQEQKNQVASVENFTEVTRLIRHEMRKMMIDCPKIMRIHTIHFSNGTETDAGLHLLKLTFLHEIVINYNVEPIAHYFHERMIPDMFLRPVSLVIRTGQYYLKRKEELNPEDVNDIALANWLTSYNPETKSMLWIAIRNTSGKVVAILAMYFPAPEAVSDQAIIRLQNLNQEIEKIYYEKYKKNGK